MLAILNVLDFMTVGWRNQNKMARSKRSSKLIKKLNGKEGSVFSTNGNLIGRGNFYYDGQLYLDGNPIRLKSLRSIAPRFNDGGALVFVDSRYKLAERIS